MFISLIGVIIVFYNKHKDINNENSKYVSIFKKEFVLKILKDLEKHYYIIILNFAV